MKKHNHEWLFVKEVARSTDKSRELCELGKLNLENDKKQKKGIWNNLFSRVDYSRAAYSALMLSPMFIQNGRRYVCADQTCKKEVEVF